MIELMHKWKVLKTEVCCIGSFR